MHSYLVGFYADVNGEREFIEFCSCETIQEAKEIAKEMNQYEVAEEYDNEDVFAEIKDVYVVLKN